MRFIKVDDETSAEELLFSAVSEELKSHNKVCWLVSGGSNIPITANVFNRLSEDLTARLTLALVDERYGDVGHADSNYAKLCSAELPYHKVMIIPILREDLTSFEATVDAYEHNIKELLDSCDCVIGQFGIGTDGHTAGILPDSPATVEDERYVIGYQGPDFQRITLSFKAIRQVNKAIVVTLGENKRQAILNLEGSNLSLAEQPAQIFKQLKDSEIINDLIGDKI